MIYLSYIAMAFVAMQLINVILNGLFRQRLGQKEYKGDKYLSILIPARNEAHNIKNLLQNLQQIKLNQVEILVYDDQSTDTTANLVKKASQEDPKIKLISSQELPQQWLGKNHACYQLAQGAQGDYYLFLDADVSIEPRLIASALYKMEKEQLQLMSVFPTQELKTWGEKASIPIMNYILLTLLPLIFVRYSPFVAHTAANGQFLLFESSTYHKMEGHKRFKSNPVEDIAIAKYYKKNGLRIACLTGDKRIKCRMYNSYSEALNGFTKNVFMFFGNHTVLAFLFWAFATLGFLPILLTQSSWLPYYILAIIAIQTIYSLIGHMNPFRTLLFFPMHLFFILQLMILSLSQRKQKNTQWKGRNIYS